MDRNKNYSGDQSIGKSIDGEKTADGINEKEQQQSSYSMKDNTTNTDNSKMNSEFGNRNADRKETVKKEQDKNRKKNPNGRSGRGFASMNPEDVKAIASMGGKAAHQSGNAHEFDSNEARKAARERWLK
jgi:hypothetical protein